MFEFEWQLGVHGLAIINYLLLMLHLQLLHPHPMHLLYIQNVLFCLLVTILVVNLVLLVHLVLLLELSVL